MTTRTWRLCRSCLKPFIPDNPGWWCCSLACWKQVGTRPMSLYSAFEEGFDAGFMAGLRQRDAGD